MIVLTDKQMYTLTHLYGGIINYIYIIYVVFTKNNTMMHKLTQSSHVYVLVL